MRAINFKSFYTWYNLAIALVIFLQVASQKKIGLGIIVFALVTIIGVIQKKLVFSFNSILALFITLFLVYAVGIFFTDNPQEIGKYMESKLSYVAFPILFFFRPKSFEVDLRWPGLALVLGVVIVSIIGLVNWNSYISILGYRNSIHQFSHVHHPTYFAAYLFVAMTFIIYGWKQKWAGFSKWSVFTFIAFGTVMTILTLSFAAVIFYFLVIGVVGIIWFKKRFGLRWAIGSVLGLLMIMVAFIYSTDLRTDIYYTSISIFEYCKNPERFLIHANRYLIGNEVRLIMWTVSILLIIQHPFGVGTGNVDQYLTEKLMTYDLKDLAMSHYNPHNQYLQTFLEIGVVGFAIIIAIIFLSARYAWRSKNWLLLIIVSSLAFNCFFESMLQRQSGIVFYTFWICLLVVMQVGSTQKNKYQN